MPPSLDAPAPAAAAANWRFDPARTQIAFAINAVGYPRTEGRFRRFEGRISVDFEHPDKSSVAFHVHSGSVDVGSSSFNDYVRSPAFLNSAKYPSIDFDSTSVQRLKDHTVRVSGELTPELPAQEQAARVLAPFERRCPSDRKHCRRSEQFAGLAPCAGVEAPVGAAGEFGDLAEGRLDAKWL